MFKQSNIQTGWYILACYAIYVVLLNLFQNGMFTDGVLYAAVSRNMAMGNGSFWDPYFASNMYPRFHEQPPFMLWVQSLFFSVLGTENPYPERVYCAVFLLLTVWVISKIWRTVTNTNTGWWPAFIWLLIPTVTWGFINNVMENTMALFDLVAVYFIYLYMAKKPSLGYITGAIVFLFLASFTKGIQGLFPLATPVLYCWAVNRKWLTKRAFVVSVVLLLAMVVAYWLVIQIPEAKESYTLYFKSRFPNFPNTPHSNTGNRLRLLVTLSKELLLPAAVVLILAAIAYFKSKVVAIQKSNSALFFLLVGFSASLPIMVSYEQRGFYLNTAMPYFALALALVFNSANNALNGIIKPKITQYSLITIAIVGIGITVFMAGKPKRDADKLADVQVLKLLSGNNTIIYTNLSLWNDWSFHNYLQRFGQISLSLDSVTSPYFVIPKTEKQTPPPGYTLVDAPTKYINVYKK